MADAQRVDAVDQLGAQTICGLLADRDRDRDGHATLAGTAVTGTDQRIDDLVEVGVGHDDHVVLGATEALRTLTVCGCGRVDVLRDVRAADKAEGLDVGGG